MAAISERLAVLGAQRDLIDWATPYGDDWKKFFDSCPRADWLLALAARLGAERRALVRAAAKCARFAMAYLPDDGATLGASLQLAERWASGQGDASECAVEAARLSAAPQDPDAVIATVQQAVTSTLSAVATGDAAAYAALCATHAAVLAAGDCAMESALRFTQERCAELAREELPADVLSALARNGH